MRVAFISPFLFRYLRGIERFTVDLANGLAQQGVDVHLLTWKGDVPWPWGEVEKGVNVHVLPLPRYFQAQWAGLAYAIILRKLRPDVVNLFFTWHGEDYALRLLRKTMPIVNLILHYPVSQVPHRYIQIKQSYALRIVTQIVAVSSFVAGGVHERFGSDSTIISSGVDLERFRPGNVINARTQLNIKKEGPVIVTVAALEERKGVHHVLSALPRIAQSFPNIVYLVAGEGPEKARLIEQTRNLGVEKNVRFLGAVPDPVPVYQAADLFLFLSKGEASPLALLEAMSSGLPIVAAKQPPLDEIATPAGTRFVDENISSQISQAVLELLLAPETRIAMGHANRQHAEQQYSWSAIAAQYIRLVQSQVGICTDPSYQ